MTAGHGWSYLQGTAKEGEMAKNYEAKAAELYSLIHRASTADGLKLLQLELEAAFISGERTAIQETKEMFSRSFAVQ